MKQMVVERDCVDATGTFVRKGGVGSFRPDPRAGEVIDERTKAKRPAYPTWARDVEDPPARRERRSEEDDDKGGGGKK